MKITCASWVIAGVLLVSSTRDGATHPWLAETTSGSSLEQRVAPPVGYSRIAQADGTFGAWLRSLPLRPEGTSVHLFDGHAKQSQSGVFAVVDVDVGARDLQQCADAVIRLRAEYLWQSSCIAQIGFNFTSGHPARWSDWAAGKRPVVTGNRVTWVAKGASDSSYASFRAYLNTVFTYAGSSSLERELKPVADPATVWPGDVFIQGGFPGHAVLVVDVVQNAAGARSFLIAQSYMPAQDIHILRNPESSATSGIVLDPSGESPWYTARSRGELLTPEWRFEYTDLRRFRNTECDTPSSKADLPDEATTSGRDGKRGQ